MADLMVTEGYQRAGYIYVMLDDCWSSLNRTQDGRFAPILVHISADRG